MKLLRNIAFACAMIFLVAVVVFVNVSNNKESKAATTAPPSSAQPTPHPTSTSGIEDEVKPTKDCKAQMSQDEYSVLVGRIVRYEELRLEPVSLQQKEEFGTLATKNYQSSHSGGKTGESSETSVSVTIEIDPAKAEKVSSVTCKIVSDSRVIVLVNPYITTTEVDASGTKTVLNSDFAIPAHYSGWVKQGNQWFVDSES